MTTDIRISPTTEAAPTDALATDLELPFAWEHGPGETDLGDEDTVFRFPSVDDPEPGSGRLLGMSLLATLQGLVGFAVGIRGVPAIVADNTPSWYEPTLAVASSVGVALVVAAFFSIRRGFLPWLLLITAAGPLAVNVVATRAL